MTYTDVSALLHRAIPALAACLPPHVAYMLVSAPYAADLIRATVRNAIQREPFRRNARIDR
jgi:hypothetical protein